MGDEKGRARTSKDERGGERKEGSEDARSGTEGRRRSTDGPAAGDLALPARVARRRVAAVNGRVDHVHPLAEVLHDVDLAAERPAEAVLRHQPVRRPEALPERKLRAHLEATEEERLLRLRIHPAARVVQAVLRQHVRAQDQRAVRHRHVRRVVPLALGRHVGPRLGRPVRQVQRRPGEVVLPLQHPVRRVERRPHRRAQPRSRACHARLRRHAQRGRRPHQQTHARYNHTANDLHRGVVGFAGRAEGAAQVGGSSKTLLHSTPPLRGRRARPLE